MRGKRTQTELCEDVQIAERTYQTWESGAIPNEKNRTALDRLAHFYDVPVTKFFLDPDLLPRPSNHQILEAINTALMESDMLRELQRLEVIPKPGSPEWNSMIAAGMRNRATVKEAGELISETEAMLDTDSKPKKKPGR